MKKILTGSLIIGSLCAFGGLLAGFVPSPHARAPEVRGRIVTSSEHIRLPLSALAQESRTMHAPSSGRISLKDTSLSVNPHDVSATPDALLRFADGNVGFLTDQGLRLLGSPGSSGSLMAFLPLLPAGVSREEDMNGQSALLASALEVAALAGEGELLNSEGYPVRWNYPLSGAVGPLCVMPRFDRTILSEPSDLVPASMVAENHAKPPLMPGFASMSMLKRASHYRDTVERYARKYKLDPLLVLAVMQTESGFNPTLISSRQAHGLMQVVPETAGDEVHRWLGRTGTPTAGDLLNPENNIRYGMAYLHLLRTRHLLGINDPQSLNYCVIASYNGGSGAVLRHFGPTREAALEAINALQPAEVLARLTTTFPARETRAFVGKVLAVRQEFATHADRLFAMAGQAAGEKQTVPSNFAHTGLPLVPATTQIPPVPAQLGPQKDVLAPAGGMDAETRARLAALSQRLENTP